VRIEVHPNSCLDSTVGNALRNSRQYEPYEGDASSGAEGNPIPGPAVGGVWPVDVVVDAPVLKG